MSDLTPTFLQAVYNKAKQQLGSSDFLLEAQFVATLEWNSLDKEITLDSIVYARQRSNNQEYTYTVYEDKVSYDFIQDIARKLKKRLTSPQADVHLQLLPVVALVMEPGDGFPWKMEISVGEADGTDFICWLKEMASCEFRNSAHSYIANMTCGARIRVFVKYTGDRTVSSVSTPDIITPRMQEPAQMSEYKNEGHLVNQDEATETFGVHEMQDPNTFDPSKIFAEVNEHVNHIKESGTPEEAPNQEVDSPVSESIKIMLDRQRHFANTDAKNALMSALESDKVLKNGILVDSDEEEEIEADWIPNDQENIEEDK